MALNAARIRLALMSAPSGAVSGKIAQAALEDHAWWYRLHRWLGARLPGLAVEVNIAGRKPG